MCSVTTSSKSFAHTVRRKNTLICPVTPGYRWHQLAHRVGQLSLTRLNPCPPLSLSLSMSLSLRGTTAVSSKTAVPSHDDYITVSQTHRVLRVPTQQFSTEQHRTIDAWGTSSRWCQPACGRPHAPDAPAATVRTLQVLIWAMQHISRLFPAHEHGPEDHWCSNCSNTFKLCFTNCYLLLNLNIFGLLGHMDVGMIWHHHYLSN